MNPDKLPRKKYAQLPEYSEILQQFKWFDLDDDHAYGRWREVKLAVTEQMRELSPVEIRNLTRPDNVEKDAIARRCDSVNYAIYASEGGDSSSVRSDLRKFSAAFGLRIAENHRSAESEGIVALQPSQDAAKRGYIPYSTRSMNWHTDGYYNDKDFRISAFVLHCVRPAESGGVNQILDPEIVYLRLRDQNPDHIRTLMHARAMSIPANHEADGSIRPASVGPVFYPDQDTGRLQMRYTARTRSIEWRDDTQTRETEQFLRDYLSQGDPLALQVSLKPGQGILNNNVLHNRTGFEKHGDMDSSRLIYRVRFDNRIARSNQWQS